MAVELLLGALVSAVPIMLAAYGEMVLERAGRVNLGVDGMMALGASVAVIVASLTSPSLGLAAGALAGALISLLYAVPVVYFRADQVVAGLALAFLSWGLADLVATLSVPLSAPIPQGSALHLSLLLLALLLPLVLWAFLYFTWAGVELRAIGYDEKAARNRGARVERTRTLSALFGGLMAGLAGAYMSLVLYQGKYFAGITSGWGWLAVGSVILGYWHPLGVALSTYAIGLVLSLRPYLEALGLGPLSVSAPYLVVILALALSSLLTRRLRLRPPTT
ncbi:MAG: ABC transporter permease [Acidilobaceae archaeon]|nr:ABC transporter permease [Acidilobaceae archaeon]MCX8165343.1 ABC transporter permease [Acidilobaceae archaeon]MDW7973769.1 ABC transporter permease [Sulfolobales archaeon]